MCEKVRGRGVWTRMWSTWAPGDPLPPLTRTLWVDDPSLTFESEYKVARFYELVQGVRWGGTPLIVMLGA